MTVPVLRINVLPKPTIRGKMDVRFPASVSGRIGVVLEKIAGHYYFDIDYSQFGETATIPDYLEQTTYFLTWESGANAFSRISVTGLKADITATFDNQYQPLDATLTALAGLDATPGLLVQTGEDTFARRSLAAPASGLTITNPAGTAGDPTFALSNDLAAVEALSGTGLARRTGLDTWSVGTTVAVDEGGTGATTAAGARTNLGLVPGTNVQAWDADLDAVAGLSSTGIIARTGAGTAATRTLTAPAAGVTVSNGDGVAGNPALALANDLAALEGLSGTGIARRTGPDAWSTGTLVSNAELATMATGTIKGNVSGSTATPSDLTATQVTAALNTMVGDSGAGGSKGLVPAPSAGDAASGKYLKADGSWQVPPGGGGGGGGSGRELLTANRTYYVRADGSDSNNGLSNSAGGAFLTIQKAANVVGALDASIYNVTISIGAGTFSEDVKLPAVLGSGVYTLTGAGVASTTIKSIEFLPRSTWKYNNVKVSGGVSLIILGAFSNVRANGPTEYGTATDDHIRLVDAMASWIAESNYTISGGAARHWRTDDGGMIFAYGRTVTLTNSPNFSDAFVRCVYGGKVIAGAMTFNNKASATGMRYLISTNAIVGVDGGGETYLPGSSNGYVDTTSGGIYR
jgi:hypothetical protein